MVVHHTLSFAGRMETHATTDAWLAENLTKQLMASYARLDIPAVMDKVWGDVGLACLRAPGLPCLPPAACHLRPPPVPTPLPAAQVRAQLPAYEQRWRDAAPVVAGGAPAAGVPAGIDLEHVMWTDPDILFRHDINSCSLPAPRLLSIGPEARGGCMRSMTLEVRGWRC